MRVSGGVEDWAMAWNSNWNPQDVSSTLSGSTFTSLTNGTTYEFRIRATTSTTSGDQGEPGEAMTASGTPGVVMLENGRVDLTASGFEVATCSGIFSDGPGDYQTQRSMSLTLAPETAGQRVMVTFNTLDLQEDLDFLYIYDGNAVTDLLAREYTGNNLPDPASTTSASPDGKLTFEFSSGEQTVGGGWEAAISCLGIRAPNVVMVPRDGKIILLWQPSEPLDAVTITGYEYQMRTRSPGDSMPEWMSEWMSEWTPTLRVDGSLFYSFANLINGTVYEFRMRAMVSGTVIPGEISTFSAAPGIVALINQRVDLIADGFEVTTCSGVFSDGEGDYRNHRSMVLILAPDDPDTKIRVTFTSFTLEEDADFLSFYHGGQVQPAFSENFTGETLPLPVTSTSPDGKLTFHFQSDSSTTREGWEGTISCPSPLGKPTSLTATPSTQTPNILLSWMSPDEEGENPITGYRIEISTNDGGAWSDLAVDTMSAITSYVHADPEAGVVFLYRVSAITGDEVGPTSENSPPATRGSGTEDILGPDFGEEMRSDQQYQVNVLITPLQLPEITEGEGSIRYTLSPELPDDMMFDVNTRIITGTPQGVSGPVGYTYTATDGLGNTDSLEFMIEISPGETFSSSSLLHKGSGEGLPHPCNGRDLPGLAGR